MAGYRDILPQPPPINRLGDTDIIAVRLKFFKRPRSFLWIIYSLLGLKRSLRREQGLYAF
jgi:hypothetical protein